MKPRVNTDGHGCGREILHTACAKFGRGEIVSAARSQLAIRQIFHALSGQLAARRIVAALRRLFMTLEANT